MASTEEIKTSGVKRPSLFWLLTEAGRAVAELGLSISYKKMYGFEPSGDGHPVLVIPGFMATDASTKRLRSFISDLGYDVRSWDLGRNFGRPETLEKLVPVLESIYEETGKEVTIIGWSLGGVYARQIAKARPHLVRQIITLASPFRGISEPNNVAWVYNVLTGGKKVTDVDPLLLADLPHPAPVPTTAVYSKQDGIVPWSVCQEAEETAIHQNVRVHGSHLGMANNPSVLKIIADRLQYNKENWEYFYPQSFFDDVVMYPSF